MILLDKMKNMKIMRIQSFWPTMAKDKKKKYASVLLTPNFESSKKLMESPLLINKKRYESYYLERDIAFYIGNKKMEEVDGDDIVEEATWINETKRSELSDGAFGVPSKRKFPLDTEAHVRSAIKFFNYVDPEDEAELARRIIAAMKKFNITDVKVSEKNRFSKYYHPKKSTNESYIEEAVKVNIKNLYHVSENNLDGQILNPKIPSNYMTKNGYEDNSTPRVCFSTSINGCLAGLSSNIEGKEFYIMVPDDISKYEVLSPGVDEVPDVQITKEKWICEPVTLKCIGKISVADAMDTPQKYKYSNNIAYLYYWNYSWINKYNESYIEEDTDAPKNPNIQKIFYVKDKFGKDNCCLKIKGYDKPFRGRSEVLIIKNNEVFLDTSKSGLCSTEAMNYTVPGGGWEKGEKHYETAVRETNEEAKIDIKNIQYVGSYIVIYDEPVSFVKNKIDNPDDWWYGYYTEVFVADYDGKYSGYIAKMDRDDNMAKNGKFYGIDDMYKKLHPIHQKAIDIYRESSINESYIEEAKFTKKYKKDIESIVATLSADERDMLNIGKNEKYQASADECFVEYDKNIPVSYFIIDYYENDGSGNVSFAVRSDYRNKGYAEKVISKGMSFIKSHLEDYTNIYWATKPNNIASQKLAEKFGFKLVRDDKEWKTYCLSGKKKPIDESYIINEKDILYNKDKFDSGEINLCFITGQSGSGKSTMGRKYSDEGAEHVEMDDLIAIKDHFTMENLKEYGDLIYSFYKGPGKKYYVGMEDLKNVSNSEYEDKLIPEFVKYSMTYAKSHKDKKFIIEGVLLYCDTEKGSPMFSPEQFKDYAFFIKGTSALISNYRASKRDSADQPNKAKAFVDGVRNFTHSLKWYLFSEKQLKKFRDYFSKLEAKSTNEIVEEDIDTIDSEEIYKYLSEQDDYLDLGDKIMFFGEATDRTNDQLKKLLFRFRIKNRKELILKLDEVKKALPWIKFAYPELKRLVGKNVFVDLYYYNAIFFQNNTWVQQRGLNLYQKFMEKLLNHPNLKNAGYEGKTIFIPVLDWCPSRDPNFWNYRVHITPISCIYQMLFEERSATLKSMFGNTDVIFMGSTNYFKINFSQIDPKDYKKISVTYKTFIRKMIFSENFDLDEIDTTAENTDSPEVIRNKIIDKIETSKGVDITPQVAKAVEDLKKSELAIKKSIKTTALDIDSTITKQDIATKKEIEKEKEEKKKDIQQSTKTVSTKQKEEEEVDDGTSTENDEAIEKIANALAKASEENDSEEDAMDELDEDEIKQALLALQGGDDKVDISPTRAARMTKMGEELLNKEVNGKTIKDILEDDTNKKENKSTYNIATPNEEEWKDLTFVNFDKNYNIDKDIINIFRHFATCTRPIAIRNIKVSDSSTAYDRTSLYDVDMEDYRGARFNIKLDIPIMEDNRFLLRGNYKSIQTQFFNAPIIKTAVDTCQLISNYKKIFLYRFGTSVGKSTPICARIIKASAKYKGRKLKFISGYNFKISNKYQLPIDYIDLSSAYTYIETPDMIIYFNQDEIRKKYIIEPQKGIPFAYHKKENAVIYFMPDGTNNFSFDKLLLDILCKADSEFEELFSATSFNGTCYYSRASILDSDIPVIVICGYLVGLRNTLDRAKISYRLESKLSKEDKLNPNLDWIKFDDGYLIYEQSYSSNIILNGLKACSTELYTLADIDNKNMYFEFLDNFGGRIKADGIENFSDLFVDPMTKESLEFYKLPTNFIDILLYGSYMLADNKFIKHTDASSRRMRRYQLIAVYTYIALSSAYAQYSITLRHNSKNATFDIKRSAIIDMFLDSPIKSDDSCINALRDVETTNAVTTKGPSGMNSARAYSLDKRAFDDSMINVLGMSTGFAANVGITRQATIQSNITSDGYVMTNDGDTKNMNDVNTLTATEALIPMSSTHDDPMRVAMSFVQTSKHEVRTEESDPLLVTNGSDEAMVYMTTNKFAYKAKMRGKILEVTDQYIILEYEDGSTDFINLQETIEHNSDGGYYVPLKLDAVKGLKAGMKIDKDQVLAYDKYSFSNSLGESDNLAYNVGKIAKVAVVNTDEGFEDSGVISASMAKKLATRINVGYTAVVNMDARVFKIAKVGDHIEASDDLLIWEDAFDDEDSNDIMDSLASNADGNYSDLGKRKLKSEITGTLKGIKIYRTCNLDTMSESVRKIVTDYEKPIKEIAKVAEKYNISKSKIPASYNLAPTGKLKKAQNAIYIEFFVEYLDTVGVGDKVVYNAANKAVEKSIFPEGLEPYTSFRPHEIVDAFVSEVSIDKRLVTSSIISGALNKLMIELDRSVKDIMGIPYDDSTV